MRNQTNTALGILLQEFSLVAGLIVATSALGQTTHEPVVSHILDQTVFLGTQLGPISFTVWDPQNTQISVSAGSSNTQVVRDADIQIKLASVDSSGTNTWSLTVVPTPGLAGTARISLLVSNALSLKTTADFALSVMETPVATAPIFIPSGPNPPSALQTGEAAPYPSVVSVQGISGIISSLQVELIGFTHPFPSDVDVLLVSPDKSKAVMLMAHAGTAPDGGPGVPANDLKLTFDDNASVAIPNNGPLASQSYQPANYASPDFRLPSPAPPGPYATTLSAFKGLSLNGDWKLYVLDDEVPDGGTIAGGWALLPEISPQPPPTISPIAPQRVAPGGTISSISFQVNSPTAPVATLTNFAVSSDQSLVQDNNIIISGTDTNRTLSITTEQNLAVGTAIITVVVVDSETGAQASSSFTLMVGLERNYTNDETITIGDRRANPYPSQIVVSNRVGVISEVTATLIGFTHSFPSDVGVLLVGPTGQKIVLMNNAGQGLSVTDLTLGFDQTTANPLPQSTALTSGSYRPANYGLSREFAVPAPTAPYTNTLDAFNGTDPNGVWSLFVEDFVLADGGAISNWSMTIKTAPVIYGLNNLTNIENTTAQESFLIADETLAVPSYTFTATSDHPEVVTNGGVVFTSSVTNWTVTVSPVTNAVGTAKISVSMLNQDGQTINTSFFATFQPRLLNPPTVSPVPDQTIAAGTTARIPLTYTNEGIPQGKLVVNFQSSNLAVIPPGNIKLNGNQLLIWPVGVQTGSSVITVTVINPINQTAMTSFVLNVEPNPTPVFANTASINIPDNHPAEPYPSTINVTGLSGNINKVTATITGLEHSFPSDLSMLLMGPQGQSAIVMSRAGDSNSISNTRLTFDDAASDSVPKFSLVTDGTYKPTDYALSDTYFPPAPVGPYGKTLSVFKGTNPNGTWSLYVQDDLIADSGVIAGGWLLSINTGGQQPFLGIARVGDLLKVRLLAVPTNTVCTLQSTGDLKAWTDVKNATSDATGSAEFDVDLAGAPSARFYRALIK